MFIVIHIFLIYWNHIYWHHYSTLEFPSLSTGCHWLWSVFIFGLIGLIPSNNERFILLGIPSLYVLITSCLNSAAVINWSHQSKSRRWKFASSRRLRFNWKLRFLSRDVHRSSPGDFSEATTSSQSFQRHRRSSPPTKLECKLIKSRARQDKDTKA